MTSYENFEGAVGGIDRALDEFRRGVLTGVDAVRVIVSQYVQIVLGTAVEPADVELLHEYAVAGVDDLATQSSDGALVEYFYELIRSSYVAPAASAQLTLHLERLEAAVKSGSIPAREDLRELCARGSATHRVLLSVPGAARAIVILAYSLGAGDALEAALCPVWSQQITDEDRDPKTYFLALDLLAHLAAHPDGVEAREAMLRLIEYLELAGDVAVRLPLAQLSLPQRRQLAESYGDRVTLLADRWLPAPLPLRVVRDSRAFRTALLLAHDAAHF